MAKSSHQVDVSGREHLERWRPALGFEGLYEVSDFGRVRRADTRRLMSLRILDNGYVIVMMCKNGKYQNQLVHRLVLKAFVGPPAPKQQCRHLNGTRTDNRLENLRWGSVSENSVDQVQHGTHRNIRKTACDYGHTFTPENTYVRPGGQRNCRTCRRERDQQKARDRAA